MRQSRVHFGKFTLEKHTLEKQCLQKYTHEGPETLTECKSEIGSDRQTYPQGRMLEVLIHLKRRQGTWRVFVVSVESVSVNQVLANTATKMKIFIFSFSFANEGASIKKHQQHK